MTQDYTGMRKGISLVEMTVAIVLFAALATIGLKYTKAFLDIDMQTKRSHIAALTDQSGQLLQAFQLYKTETGSDLVNLTDLNGSSAIMTAIPTKISEMSSNGWQYAADHNGTGLPAFFVNVDLNGTLGTTARVKSAKEYCALFNRQFDSTTSLNIESTTNFGTLGNITTSKTNFARNSFCWSKDANNTQIVVFVP